MNKLIHSVGHFVKQNAPTILSAGAVIGTVATAYLTGRASYKAALDINKEFGPDASNRQKVKHVWKGYIPAGLTCVGTVACVVGSQRVANRRMLAATMAYTLTEQAYSQYKDKVIEQFGDKKDQAIRDKIAEEQVLANPKAELPQAKSNELVFGEQKVLCLERYTGRYFLSDMETLRRAQNDLNARLIAQDSCSLDDFYYLIKLRGTQFSSDLGWNSDKMLDLEFTSVIAPDGRPCIAFRYNYVRPLYGGGVSLTTKRGLCMADDED